VQKLNVEALTAIVAIMLEVAIVGVYQLGRQVRTMRAELGPRKDTQIVQDDGGVVDAVKRLSRTVYVPRSTSVQVSSHRRVANHHPA
jgi:hypothetical protein